MVRSAFARKGLWLRVDAEPDLPQAFVDRTRIRQVLLNLVSNSLRFTERGGVTIGLRKGEEGLVISAHDTGVGIASEEATWHQSTRGLSDGSLTLKGATRPPGGQDEGFFHTRWGGQPGDVSDWLVAWPTAFRLFVLMHWPGWDDFRTQEGMKSSS